MKSKVFILFIFSLSLVGCQDEEFYEKDYIDTVKDQLEREGQPVDTFVDTDDSGSSTDDQSNDQPIDLPQDQDDSDVENSHTDSFTQSAQGGKLDILWVIDNSGSMGDEQRALGDNFDAFIQEFTNKDVDFQMAVTTTDTRSNYIGRAMGDSLSTLNSNLLASDRNRFLSKFSENVQVGVRGSGIEKGIKGSYAFTQNHTNWFRSDAYYIVVYMSDEEDQSEEEVSFYIDQLKQTKANQGLVRAYSIVQKDSSGSSQGAISRGYARYKEASDSTNGKVADIRNDFYLTLLEMGEEISKLTEMFPLSQVPKVDSLEITVDNAINTDWSYQADTNSIKFSNAPSNGAKIKINYSIK